MAPALSVARGVSNGGRPRARSPPTQFPFPTHRGPDRTPSRRGESTASPSRTFFVGGDRHLIALCANLAETGCGRATNLFAHPDSFGAAGLTGSDAANAPVDYGVETGSVSVARRNHRALDPDGVVGNIEAAVAAGIELHLVDGRAASEGAPELAETEQLIERTMRSGGATRWVKSIDPFPENAIHERPQEYGVSLNFRGFLTTMPAFPPQPLAEALMFDDVQTSSYRRPAR